MANLEDRSLVRRRELQDSGALLLLQCGKFLFFIFFIALVYS
jgi:hypothetical protein